MSHTTLCLIDPVKGTCEEFEEFSNSHGSAPVVWGVFCEHYLHRSEFDWLHNDGDALWKLYKDTSIPLSHRAVLMMTFDKAIIYRKDFQRAIFDIQKFLEDFPPNPDYINHWPAICLAIAKVEFYTDAPAYGIHHTSVTGNPMEKYNEETEDYVLSDELYDLYAELDAIGEVNNDRKMD